MIRRMTLVTLALALMTTLAAPIAWGQTLPTERGASTDPDGQPNASALTFNPGTTIDMLSSEPALATPQDHATRNGNFMAANETKSWLLLSPQLLLRILGI